MQNTLDRRAFTRLSVLTMLSGVVVTITGCGGGSSGGGPTGPGPTPSNGDKAASISANHGHSAIVTNAQLTAGNAVLVTLQGTVGVPEHTHTVQLSAAEVTSIRDGARVSRPSTVSDAHEHTVTFN